MHLDYVTYHGGNLFLIRESTTNNLANSLKNRPFIGPTSHSSKTRATEAKIKKIENIAYVRTATVKIFTGFHHLLLVCWP